MLESLKDLYVSYPFLPVAEKPAWFNHIKDVRLTVVLDAANAISEYKNANNVRAWLTAIDPSKSVATFKVQCLHFGITDMEVTANLMRWEDGSPSIGSYTLVDDISQLPAITDAEYELNPDVLLFMQKAPVMYYENQEMPRTIAVKKGHNVMASLTPNGIELFGSPGVGEQRYTKLPQGLYTYDNKKSLGVSSINGMQNMVWLTASFPTKIQTESNAGNRVTLTISREKL